MNIKLTYLHWAPILLIALCTSVSGAETPHNPLSAAGHTYFAGRYEYDIIPFTQEIIKELNLTQSQVQAIDKNNRRSVRQDPYSFGAQIEDYKQILLILSNDQKIRFEQLKLQHVGALHAFLIPKIKLGLDINDEQYDTLAFLFRTYHNGIRNLNSFETLYLGQGYSRSRYGKALLTAADRMAESVLSAEQHLKWMGLQGRLLDPLPTIWR